MALLAHDLRSPLTVLKTNLYYLAQPEDENDRQALLLACREAAQRIERTVENLALLTSEAATPHPDAGGQLAATPEPTELVALLAQVAGELEAVFRARGQRLELELPERAARIALELPLARLLAANALINAAEQSRMGSVIQARLALAEGSCTLTVEDDGDAIAPELVEHVFDLDAAAELTGQKVRIGKGLGLIALRRVARAVQGDAKLAQPSDTQRRRLVVTLPTL